MITAEEGVVRVLMVAVHLNMTVGAALAAKSPPDAAIAAKAAPAASTNLL